MKNQLSAREWCVAWLPVLIWMVVIFGFSAQARSGEITGHYLGDWNLPVRKSAHCFEYAVLFLLSNRALLLTTDLSLKVAPLVAILIAGLYSLSDEWHQSFVPGRSSSLSDCMVDMCGVTIALAGLFIYRAVNNAISRRSNPASQKP